ncbi:hypothetical protein BDR26DRAFT_69409 [Obelidium mucronatum]|nr:hypothetical protein BDR26DRAFT_69409 [Obelidium mucronatum]
MAAAATPPPLSPSNRMPIDQFDKLSMIMHIANSLSIVACLAVLTVVYRYKHLHTTINLLICWMIGTKLTMSLVMVFGTLHPDAPHALFSSNVPCYIQGILTQFFGLATYSWDFLIALHCGLIVFSSEVPHRRWLVYYHMYAWGVATIFTGALFVVQKTLNRGEVIGDAVLECWISDHYKKFRIYFMYVIVWAHYIALIAIYVAITWKIKQVFAKNATSCELMKAKLRVVYKTVALGVGFGIAWLPGTVSRLYPFTSGGLDPPFWLLATQCAAISSHALIDSIIFLFFTFYQFKVETAKDGENSEMVIYETVPSQIGPGYISA